MDMKKMILDFCHFQRDRENTKLVQKNMAKKMRIFTNVRYTRGSDPPRNDVTVKVRQGSYPDSGIISFHGNEGFRDFFENCSTFDDQENDAGLRIRFHETKEEDIQLMFMNKTQKEEFVGLLKNFMDLSECSDRSNSDSGSPPPCKKVKK